MEGLLSFLLFAGLFFLMMRFGCGAHMMHGHHGPDEKNDTEHTDPVCGMKVDAKQGYGLMHKGLLYRFCSKKCLDQFEQSPDLYISSHKHHAGGAS